MPTFPFAFRSCATAVAVAAVVFFTLQNAGCGGGKENEGGVPAVESLRFEDWSAFLSSEQHARNRPRQVVVIGIDGAPWHYVDRLIERGDLPNLARIKREGAYATLRSTRSYVTPPAWTSMFTGYLPEETGIYSFGRWVPETREFLATNSDDVEVPIVWDAASTAGLRVGVFNVPMTYPVHPVNGSVVSGMMTPIETAGTIAAKPLPAHQWISAEKSDAKIADYAQPMRAALGDSLNDFLFWIHDTTDNNTTDYDLVSLRVFPQTTGDSTAAPLGECTFGVGEYSNWFPVLCRKEEAVVQGWSRAKLDLFAGGESNVEFGQTLLPIDAVYTYPQDLQKALADRFGFYLPSKFLRREIMPVLTQDMSSYATFFYDMDDWDQYFFVFTQSDMIHHMAGFGEVADEVYRTIDRTIGDIMNRLPPGAMLFVASDHGNGEFDYIIDVNQMFRLLDLLEWESPGRIDYDKTLVFHNLWHIYFNRDRITREELEKRGIEVPAGQDPYEYLMLYVTEAGRQLRSRDGSRQFPIEFYRIEGRRRGDPDMGVIGSHGDYRCEFWNIMKPRRKMISKLEGSDKAWHIRDGIFLAWGDDVRRGYDAGVKQIQDVGPTILYLSGLPVAPDMAGSVMEDIFVPGFLRGQPMLVNAGYRDIPKEPVLDSKDRESLRRKLRSLGYAQ